VALRQDWSQDPCPIARSLDVVGDPWVMLVLREALLGARRFEQFRTILPIAENVLSRRLAQMVDAGLLCRSPYRSKQRMHEEYVVTDAGKDLLPVLVALTNWGNTHTTAPERHTEMLVRHQGTDHHSSDPSRCTECGEPMTSADRVYERRWVG
jgi:DNA-binding HxlR family transcriptional regulator